MMAEEVVRSFEAWDYVLFALMLVISMAIGIFYAWRDRKGDSTSEFLMASRGMTLIPVTISILVSFMSAILILGAPAEMMTEGTQYFLYIIGISMACVAAAVIYAPLLYPLKLTSSYEQPSNQDELIDSPVKTRRHRRDMEN